MNQVKVGAQLYSVRKNAEADFAKTLRGVKECGYDGVEMFGSMDRLPAAQLKTMLADTGLDIYGWHAPLEWFEGSVFEKTVAYHLELGNPTVIVPGISNAMLEQIGWTGVAERINTVVEKLKPYGLRTGYHNHWDEFQKNADGQTNWDTLFGKLSKDAIMQLDMGNGLKGGAELVKVLNDYPARSASVHLKPFSHKDGFATMIGQDDVPWKEVLEACRTLGNTKWYIVEYESEEHYPDVMDALRDCRKALKALGL